MSRGFIYLVAVVIKAEVVLGSLQCLGYRLLYCGTGKAIKTYCRPETFNTDEGGQSTSADFNDVLVANNMQIGIYGKVRLAENVFVERL